jgi:hypothetical protein
LRKASTGFRKTSTFNLLILQGFVNLAGIFNFSEGRKEGRKEGKQENNQSQNFVIH